MSIITIYRTFYDEKPYYLEVDKVLERIRNGKSERLVNEFRQSGNERLKKQLPSILFSGRFSQRNSQSLIQHSGLICLDFDKFPSRDELGLWRDNLDGDEYTYACFTSPSGRGLKCLVKIPPHGAEHKRYFESLKTYYNCPYFDSKCSDVCRICFESWDPELRINKDSKVWHQQCEYTPLVVEYFKSSLDEVKTAENLLKWWYRRFGLNKGERNNNLFRLCAAFNDYGISKEYARSIVSSFQQEDFKLSEIEVTLNSAYKKTAKHGILKF